MGKPNKQQRAVKANGAKTWATIGKNPHVLDLKIEFGIHKLVYLDLRPNQKLSFTHSRQRFPEAAVQGYQNYRITKRSLLFDYSGFGRLFRLLSNKRWSFIQADFNV
jgi:hypothetical protein